MYYLDNAATSYPKPDSVKQAAVRALALGNPGRGGHALSAKAEEIVYGVREKAAVFFGTSPERVVFTQNATHALNIALAGASGEVVTSDMEHNAVRRPLENNRQVRRIVAQTAEDDWTTVENFRACLTPRTTMCCVTAQSNVTGRRLPVAAIAALCNHWQIPLVVDASQAAGTMDLNVDRDGIAMLCTAGHKGLYGIMGSGLLVLGRNVCPPPLMYGGSGGESWLTDMPSLPPERLEAGTLSVPAIAALGAGLDFVNRCSRAHIEQRERRLAQELWREMAALDRVVLYGYPESGTFLFNIEGMPAQEVATRLDRVGIAVRAGLHCAPDAHKKLGTGEQGGVRVSFGALQGAETSEKMKKEIKKL